MKTLKRKFSLVLAVMMMLAMVPLVTSCTAGGGAGGLIELTIYSQLANFAGVQSGWAGQVFEEKFGVKINIINEMDGTFATRMATGNLGDIVIFGSDGNQYQQAVAQGMLLDWEQDNLLQEHGAYIYENMPFALQKNRDMEIANDTIYGFGFDVAGSAEDHQTHIYYPYLRWDLYQQLGKPAINTLEDFIPVLRDMKALEPVNELGQQTWGVSSFPDWDGDMVMMVKATAALYGWEEFGIGLYHVVTQEFEDALKPGGQYLRMLKFYNTLHQMGLFDPDSMTQTFDDAATKYRNGTSFWNIFTFVAEGYNMPENLEAGRMLACVPAADQTNLAEGLNVYGGTRVWSIGSRTVYPELAMQIINWLCTPEGVLTYNYGPQGVTWDYDEEGNTYLTEVGLLSQDDNRTVIVFNGVEQAYQDGQFQHNNTTWTLDAVNPDSASGETFNWRFWDSTILNREVAPIEQSWRDWAGGVTTADDFLRNEGKVAVSIGTPFTLGRREAELEMTWEQVKGVVTSGSWRAIYAGSDQEFDSIVADMIAEANAYGYARCVEWILERAEARREAENIILNN